MQMTVFEMTTCFVIGLTGCFY